MTDNIFEEFLRLFAAVRKVTHDNPQQIINHYWQHQKIKAAVDALEMFVEVNDFDRLVFSGTERQFGPVPGGFEKSWSLFKDKWLSAVLGLKNTGKRLRLKLKLKDGTLLEDKRPDDPPSVTPLSAEQIADRAQRNRIPDFEYEEEFDPYVHDGGEAIDFVLSYIKDKGEYGSGEVVDNMSRIGSQAFEYLSDAIGLDFKTVFKRWNSIPPIFYPKHVVTQLRSSKHASTVTLIDDTIKAYVFGARAAAIAMCRGSLEDVLKQNYGNGAWDDEKLGKIVVLASGKYKSLVSKSQLKFLVERTNSILHNFSSVERDEAEEDKVILKYLLTVKHLIQNAPGRN